MGAGVDRGHRPGWRERPGRGHDRLREHAARLVGHRGQHAVERGAAGVLRGAIRPLRAQLGRQHAECRVEIRHDDLDAQVIAEVLAVADRRPRAEQDDGRGVGPRRRDELDRVEPHAHDEVRRVQERCLDGRAGGDPRRVRPGLRDDTLGLVGGEDGHGRPRHEAAQAAGRCADAGDDDRPARVRSAARTVSRSAGGRAPSASVGASWVPGADGSRSRWTGPGGPARLNATAARTSSAVDVAPRTNEPLVTGPSSAAWSRRWWAMRPRPAAGTQSLTSRRGWRSSRACATPFTALGDTRTAGDDAGARPAAELGCGRGHEHRRALGVGEDEAQPLGLGCADDVEVAAAARQAEQELDARVAEAGGDQLSDRPAHRSPRSAAVSEGVPADTAPPRHLDTMRC